MGRFSRNPVVRQMREEFSTCPGCNRNLEQIIAQRPHPEMTTNMLLTVEHVTPRSRGGTDQYDNLLIVCHRCNFVRGNQTPWDWNGAQHHIYQEGWPVPQLFYGKAGRANRLLWEGRAQAIAALLGWGPVPVHPTWQGA